MFSRVTNQANRIRKLLTVLLCFTFGFSFAQPGCAGTYGQLTVCNYADPTNQNIDLFSLLGGSPTPGGTWSDPLLTGGLNATTGILNLWNVHTSGTFVFHYTVNSGGCSDTADVTVTVGGYSGISTVNNSACSNDTSVNLFQFFVAGPPNPHQNGTWTDDDNTGALIGSVFNAFLAGVGTYHFTYTMPAVGSCPAVSSSMTVTVYRSPISGNPIELVFCNTSNFTNYTNVNLANYLTGEDPNGQWTEGQTTELSSPIDSFVNVQNIFNTFGIGTYSFNYTVYPTHPVCTPKTSTVNIYIEEFLDFTGSTFTVNSDICENQLVGATFTGVISPPIQTIPSGQYRIVYQVVGNPTVTVTQNNVTYDGTGFSFSISPTLFPTVGNYTVNITAIKKAADKGGCNNLVNLSDVLHISPMPFVTASVSFSPMCQNTDGLTHISGNPAIDSGNYQITYNLSGANVATNQTVNITAVAGAADFTIPAALLQNAGATTLTITLISNLQTGCLNSAELPGTFTVNGITATNLTALVADSCSNSAANVTLSGLGTMSGVMITYNLSGANTAVNQTLIAPVNAGTATLTIPSGLLSNSGNTTFTITQVTNNVTFCSSPVTVPGISFTVLPVPPPPAASDAVFCISDNPIVANLHPAGVQFHWYDSPTATNQLPLTTPVVAGLYYVGEVTGTAGCESSRTAISVTLVEIEPPVLNPDGQHFCAADNPKVLNLSANMQASGPVIWFNAAVNGMQLPSSTPLINGATYYGVNTSAGLGCFSDVLPVTVLLDACPEFNFFIPDGFSPNNDNVNDVFRIPNIQYAFPDYVLEIYNRYGNLMFKGNRNNPAWDGKNSQSDTLIDGIAPNGVYFYIVYFNKDNAAPRQGQLYLNR